LRGFVPGSCLRLKANPGPLEKANIIEGRAVRGEIPDRKSCGKTGCSIAF
jgi:hypothetical protein